MKNLMSTMTTLLLSALLLTGCVGYLDDANKSLDYDELKVAFQATFSGKYELSADNFFGVYGTCTRGGLENVEMSPNGVSKYAHASSSPYYFYKSSDDDVLMAKKGDHSYHFYAYYPYDPSCSDLKSIPVKVPAKVTWSNAMTPQTMVVATASPTSVIAPVKMVFEAAPMCVLKIRIPQYAFTSIKKVKVHPKTEASFKNSLAFEATYNIFDGKLTKKSSTESKSIEVDFGGAYTLQEGYTDISILMGAVSYPAGGLEMIVTDGDDVETAVLMYNAKQVFKAGSETTYTMK